MEALGFAILSLLLLVPAYFVVRSDDLVRAVLWLTFTLLSTAGLYAMLDAPFLAGIQVLTYVGGVITLMVFGVMVTQRSEGARVAVDRVDGERGLAVAAGLFVVMALSILRTELPSQEVATPTTVELARSLLGEHLMSFEAASLLLLGAIVGAVVLARRRDAEETRP